MAGTHRNFDLVELAEGVHAAIHREGGTAYSNAGIVDLGEGVLVFDTFETLTAARELRSAVLDVAGRPPRWVVNSHSHGDHWTGNQVFAAEATLLSTHRTRAALLEWGAELEALRENPGRLQAEIRDLEARLAAETDPAMRTALQRSLTRERANLADLPGFCFCPPVETFSGRLVIHGSRRTAELVATGPAHTPEECYLSLPGEKILFAGDLAFFDCPPFLPPDCDPDGWIKRLEAFLRLEGTTFVPGHGPLGGAEALKRQKRYIQEIRRQVRAELRRGADRERVVALPLPEAFADWAAYRNRHMNNLRSLYRLEKQAAG